jgi:alkaline phosphatase
MPHRSLTLICLVLVAACGGKTEPAADRVQPVPHAKNVILFLADGTGIPTLNAASIHAYGEPQKLFLYQLPHIALSECSAADNWVNDSAAGMTAIVTGNRTDNGVISQGPEAVRGEVDGPVLKTILEYAEERGLSTGVVSNSPMADATPAACYAHSNDRGKTGEIFAQILKPPYGDGVDVVIGPGRDAIVEGTEALGVDLEGGLRSAGYAFVDSEEAMEKESQSASRLVALYGNDQDYDLAVSAAKALEILSRNPKGYFLMIESNNHSTDVKATLDNAVKMDRIIRSTVEKVAGTDTLVLVTADHSYGLRLPNGPVGELVDDYVEVESTHTGEEVIAAATGPGSEQVHGAFLNTHLFTIMKTAYGW